MFQSKHFLLFIRSMSHYLIFQEHAKEFFTIFSYFPLHFTRSNSQHSLLPLMCIMYHSCLNVLIRTGMITKNIWTWPSMSTKENGKLENGASFKPGRLLATCYNKTQAPNGKLLVSPKFPSISVKKNEIKMV